MAVPSEFKYSKEHEWVKVEGNTATIGITEYAQGELETSYLSNYQMSMMKLMKGYIW